MNKKTIKLISLFLILSLSGLFSQAQSFNKKDIESCEDECADAYSNTLKTISKAEMGMKISKEEGINAIRFSKSAKDANIAEIRHLMEEVQKASDYFFNKQETDTMFEKLRNMIIKEAKNHNERVTIISNAME